MLLLLSKVIIPVRSVIDAGLHAAVFETCVRAAWAQIVAAELLGELDVAMDEPPPALDMGFRGEGLPPLTRDAESWGGFRNRDACAWPPPVGLAADRRAGSVSYVSSFRKPRRGCLESILPVLVFGMRLHITANHALRDGWGTRLTTRRVPSITTGAMDPGPTPKRRVPE
jgi:hypothetical protein